ncbi:hypothetical protein F5144DRAFT_199203 [Chaetomium tenue]|uniref:Uncharacterized protein n=1 Tax=Chaetomium tenue TaxID=1854479 RepID=A0ACB7PEZ0_9PEZI|nr:hypothetical protein F5144DRAFT_199203 [Chaetomium globosum]
MTSFGNRALCHGPFIPISSLARPGQPILWILVQKVPDLSIHRAIRAKNPRAPLFAAARPPPLDDGNWVEENIIPLTLSPLDGFGTESPLVSSPPPSKAPPHARIHCTWLGSLVRELGHPTAGPQMSWHREELNPFCDPTRKHSLLLASPGFWDRFSHLFVFAIESPRRAGCLVGSSCCRSGAGDERAGAGPQHRLPPSSQKKKKPDPSPKQEKRTSKIKRAK